MQNRKQFRSVVDSFDLGYMNFKYKETHKQTNRPHFRKGYINFKYKETHKQTNRPHFKKKQWSKQANVSEMKNKVTRLCKTCGYSQDFLQKI